MLAGRRVLLGVSGGVAAYKAAYLCRLLIEAGAEVRVAMTEGAGSFMGPATFAALSGSPVTTSVFEATMVSPHTELGRWSELVIVAPATAATIARIANGLSDEILSLTVLATRAPVLLAPAMHTEMWEHPATRRNVESLLAFGVHLVGPSTGPLAGGDEGPGRMAEPEEILAAAASLLTAPLRGRAVLVTAGGTREAIDPVRYIGNRSTGKMGHAIASEAARRGADVVLVTASELPVDGAMKLVRVDSAAEMAEAVAGVDPEIAIMAAAVADFRPRQPPTVKISRSEGPPTLDLEPTLDILASVATRPSRPYLVGFAAEAGGLGRAIEKAKAKGVDLLVANDVTEPGAGFGHDTNRVSIIWPDGRMEAWPLLSKVEVARRLWDLIQGELNLAR
jgi:phosphopantothenoylcysteine decarboxylase/phosphopantothenate--cysteine ligase